MPPSSSSLPTVQLLLTSLLDTIAAIPAPDAESQQQQQATQLQAIARTKTVGRVSKRSAPSNPLKLLSPSHRNYFLTLHVLFPSLLLPALDLLDRGLVARLSLPLQDDDDEGGGDGVEEGEEGEESMTPHPPPPPIVAAAQEATTTTKDEKKRKSPSQVYHVQSAVMKKQNSHHFERRAGRRPDGRAALSDETSSGGHSLMMTTTTSPLSSFYVVHTASWNCTCAAFALAAFPPPEPGPGPGPKPETTTNMVDSTAASTPCDLSSLIPGISAEEGDEMVDEKPLFGGLGLFTTTTTDDDDSGRNGKGGGMPPCCKHLLACVLAERWEAVFGRYVTRRTVTREEMAGIFADT